MKSVIELKVLGNYIDANGHMNNSRYFEFFEAGRWDYLKKTDARLLKEHGISHVLANISVNFKTSAFEGQKLQVETSIAKKDGKSLTIEQRLLFDATFLADCTAVNVFFDMKTGDTRTINSLVHLWPVLNNINQADKKTS